MRREITDVFLRGVRPPATGRTEIWDEREQGLMLRITSNGKSTWSVRARLPDGRRTRVTLGQWPVLGVVAARRLAKATATDILRGADPVQAKREAEAEKTARAGLPTVRARLDEWVDARAARWASGYATAVRRMCATEIVPHLGDCPLTDTSRQDWTGLIARKAQQSPSSGANLYRLSSAFLNHAEAVGWTDRPLLPRKGASVLAPAVKARTRTLSDEELHAIWIAADDFSTKQRAFIHLLCMTAARRQEVADVSTGELDLDAGWWQIPPERAKNGVTVVLPLHPLLIADLRAIWPEHGHRAGPGWRLLGDIAGSGLSGFSKIKQHLDAKSAVTDWVIHDLRRTARTGMARLGVPNDHAEAALNHVSGRSALERIYDRHDYAPEVIAALSRWQAHVATLVSDRPQADVLPLRRVQ